MEREKRLNADSHPDKLQPKDKSGSRLDLSETGKECLRMGERKRRNEKDKCEPDARPDFRPPRRRKPFKGYAYIGKKVCSTGQVMQERMGAESREQEKCLEEKTMQIKNETRRKTQNT